MTTCLTWQFLSQHPGTPFPSPMATGDLHNRAVYPNRNLANELDRYLRQREAAKLDRQVQRQRERAMRVVPLTDFFHVFLPPLPVWFLCMLRCGFSCIHLMTTNCIPLEQKREAAARLDVIDLVALQANEDRLAMERIAAAAAKVKLTTLAASAEHAKQLLADKEEELQLAVASAEHAKQLLADQEKHILIVQQNLVDLEGNMSIVATQITELGDTVHRTQDKYRNLDEKLQLATASAEETRHQVADKEEQLRIASQRLAAKDSELTALHAQHTALVQRTERQLAAKDIEIRQLTMEAASAQSVEHRLTTLAGIIRAQREEVSTLTAKVQKVTQELANKETELRTANQHLTKVAATHRLVMQQMADTDGQLRLALAATTQTQTAPVPRVKREPEDTEDEQRNVRPKLQDTTETERRPSLQLKQANESMTRTLAGLDWHMPDSSKTIGNGPIRAAAAAVYVPASAGARMVAGPSPVASNIASAVSLPGGRSPVVIALTTPGSRKVGLPSQQSAPPVPPPAPAVTPIWDRPPKRSGQYCPHCKTVH